MTLRAATSLPTRVDLKLRPSLRGGGAVEGMIDEVLDRLLHRRSYLARFLEDPKKLAFSAEDLDALAVIDRDELVSTAAAVRRDVMRRNHRGSGSLVDLYPRTIGARDVVELVADFMESPEFDAYREVPFAGVGLSLEESFYRYCEAHSIGEPVVREREFLAAMVKALLLSPRPDFHVPAAILPCPRGVFAVAGTTLFAALGQQFVTGPLTPFLVELLLRDETAASIAERHRVSPAVLEATIEQLRALGLRA
jgi:hypothetical protein